MSNTIKGNEGVNWANIEPNEFVSLTTKQTKKWTIAKANYLNSRCRAANPDHDRLRVLMNIANGQINERDYNYVTNPFHSDNPKLKEFPARLRNHNIITPIVYHFVGEYIKSKFKYNVGINNEDVETKRKSEELALVNKAIDVLMADKINQVVNGAKPKENVSQDLATIVAEFNENWEDSRVVQGDAVLEYLKDKFDFDYIYWSAYVDWIITGRFITYKDVRFDDIHLSNVPPNEFFPVFNGSEYIEDIDESMRVFQLPLTSIITEYREFLDKKDIKYIKELIRKSTRNNITITANDSFYPDYHGEVYDYVSNFAGSNDINIPLRHGNIEVIHYVWKSIKQIKILEYIDNLGNKQETEVDDDYILNSERNELLIRKEYVDQYLEMYKFGGDRISLYTKPRPIAVQRNEINNSSICKNPYGGKLFLFNGLFNPSIVEPIIPYQVIYNIIHYHRETAIANNVGKIMVIPKGLLVDDDEISMAEAVYYIKADKKLYVNEQADGFSLAMNAIKSVDADDADYIISLSKILQEIKEEAWDAIGMNRQRYGDTYASDGKATTEQAIYRASIGTAPIVEIFNKARLKDYMALIDYAKFAWLEDSDNRSLGSYKNSEGRVKYLNINPKEFAETDYGLYVNNNTQDEEKIKAYKELAFSAAQNGAFELALESIDEDNKTKLRNIIKAWRKLEDQREQAKQQAAAQQAQQAQQVQSEILQATLNNNLDVKSIDAQAKIEVANINANSQKEVQESANEGKQNIESLKQVTDKYKADTQKEIAKIQSLIKGNISKK